MIFISLLLSVLLNIHSNEAALFMWSSKKLEISPLQPFNEEHFLNLTEDLDYPEIFYFRSSSIIPPYIKDVIDGYNSTYLPNGHINIKEGIDLSGSDVIDVERIKETLSTTNKSSNILSVIVVPNKRYKRNIVEASTEKSEEKKPLRRNGPVIYKKKHTNNDVFALLYSSKPLLLKINDSNQWEHMELANTPSDMIIYDNRLNIIFKFVEGPNVALRFSFSWLNGYWSLPSVKISDLKSSRDHNLTTDENISAPAHFSYHCNGQSLFTNGNGVELYIYDLQVQPDSRNGKFGDPNDCVSFTTAPIWSGLFVATLLGIGFIFALTAIMDIKTMDKFDNHKTKNLSITISD